MSQIRPLVKSFYENGQHAHLDHPTVVPPLGVLICEAARSGHSETLRFFFNEVSACRDNPSGEPWSPINNMNNNYKDVPDQWQFDTWHNSVAIAAVQSGKPQVFQTLLDHGMHVDATPERFGTPFEVALSRHDFAMARFLLSQGSDIYGNGAPLGSSFSVRNAARDGDVKSLRFLLDNGAEIEGTKALEGAAETGCVSTAEIVLDAGADIDEVFEPSFYGPGEKDENYCSALHTAIRWDQPEFVRFLVQRGANLDVQDGIHQTPAQLAENRGKSKILGILREAKLL